MKNLFNPKGILLTAALASTAACTTTMSDAQFEQLSRVVSADGQNCMNGSIQTTPEGRVTAVSRGWDQNCDAQQFVTWLADNQLYDEQGRIDQVTAGLIVSMAIEANPQTQQMIDNGLARLDLTLEGIERDAVQARADDLSRCHVTEILNVPGVGQVEKVECDDEQPTTQPQSGQPKQVSSTSTTLQFKFG